MTPERIANIRRYGVRTNQDVIDLCDIVEREAKLREACKIAVSQLWSVIAKEAEHPLIPVYEHFAEILETKGGET